MPSKSRETTVPLEGLSPEERASLVTTISEQTNQLAVAYRRAPNWDDARHYFGLIGMMSYLESPLLDGRHLDHTRKIVAHEYLALSQPEQKPPNTAAFLKEVRAQAGSEIKEARKFKGEVDEMPPPYREAFDDWDQIRSSFVTDRLMLSLRQSVRNIRQGRQT